MPAAPGFIWAICEAIWFAKRLLFNTTTQPKSGAIRTEGLWAVGKGGNKGEGASGKGEYRIGGFLTEAKEGHTILVPEYEDEDGL